MTDEQDWIETFRHGDADARRRLWGRVYARHAASALGLARSVLGVSGLAEDVLQETFLAAWRHGGRFRGDGTLKGWILTIAANLARRTLVRERARAGREARAIPRPSATAPTDAATRALAEDRNLSVHRALAALPPEQRLAVGLSVMRGIRTEEIAAMLGCPVGTVWSRIHHAKKKLARWIGGPDREGER